MKANILNKRKQWLDKSPAQSLDTWPTNADKLEGFTGTLQYFGIMQSGGSFIINSSDSNQYFRQSLALFKIVLQKQIAKEKIGIPNLEQLPVYDALITIVGYSPEPLMHTALALAPKKLYPVATEESAKDFYKVPLNQTTRKPEGNIEYFSTIIEHNKEQNQTITVEPIGRNVASIGSIDTFKRVREIIQEVRKDNPNATIALDITGGKKSADASAFLTAAIEENIDIFYVDFEDYTGTKACCGTEFLNKLDNPYDIYNIQLLNQAKELFRNHNYAGANELFKSALKKLDDNILEKYNLEQEKEKIEKMQKAAECYMYWDRFEYEKALKLILILPEYQKIVLKNSSLDKHSNTTESYFFALDLIMNAKRRFKQGNINDAHVRLIQALEFILDYFLKNVNHLNIPDKCELGKMIALTFGEEIRFGDKTFKANKAIRNNNELKNKIKAHTERRNLFIHEIKSMDKECFNKTLDAIKLLLDNLIKKTPQAITDDMKKFAFSTEFNEDGTLKLL